MARPLRIQLPELIYHVLNRGNNRQAIFLEQEDYRDYQETLLRYKEKFGFKLFAYQLMTNHVHLLIQTSEKANISQIMQAVTISHTRNYHHKYQSSGHVWQGRFKSPLVETDEHFLAAMRYIEQNCLRAKMVCELKDYPWSSFHKNALGKDDPLVDTGQNPVYLGLASRGAEREEAYLQLVSEPLAEGIIKDIRHTLRGESHYASERFKQEIADKLKLRRKRVPGRPRMREFVCNLL